MKSLMSAVLILLMSNSFYGQEVTFKTEKKDFKSDEIINVIFEVKSSVDSETALTGENFTVLSGPKKRLQTSTKDGQTSSVFTSTYYIKANSPGKVTIVSPTFTFNDQEKSAGTFVLNVSEDKLTETEKDQINFNKFKENGSKQDGCVRFVVSDNYGFLEQFDGSKWEFKRRLSAEEVKTLSKK